MLRNITYYPIFGKPLIMWLGLTTLILFLITAIMGYLVFKRKLQVRYHLIMAATTITLGIIHSLLGTLLYF